MSVADNSALLRMPASVKELGALCSLVQHGCAESLWLGGSTLRNILVGSISDPAADVDFFFFNRNQLSKSYEKDIEAEIRERTGIARLSIKNQARMGAISDGVEYENLLQSVTAFPDVSIAIAARVIFNRLSHTTFVFAPYGLPKRDALVIQPTSRHLDRHGLQGYYAWIDRKMYERKMVNWGIGTVSASLSPSPFHVLSD